MADRKFLKAIDDACENALLELGFKRPRRGTIYLEIKSGFLGWVGLNVGNHGDIVNINPNIGIHCVDVMRLKHDFVADKANPYKIGQISTYGLPLGTQTPRDIDAIQFHVGAPVEGEARRLSLLIGEYGVPWMLEHASYDALIPLLEKDFAHLPNYPERLAAMYYFAGDISKAISFTNEVRKQLETEGDEAGLEHFNRFATPFLKMIGEKGLTAR